MDKTVSLVTEPAQTRPGGAAAEGQLADWAVASHPASPAQEALCFLDQTLLEPAAYNIAFRGALDGPVRLPELRLSLDSLIQRYEILRTRFQWRGGELRQLVAREAPVELQVLDLQACSGDEQARRLAAATHDLARRRFDLARGPLLRTLLARLGPDRQQLLLVVHHSIFDGLSLKLLLTDWRALYGRLVTGAGAELPPLAAQFGDHARRQRQRLAGEHLEQLRAYWRGHLAGAPGLLALPTDRPRPRVQGSEAGFTPFLIPPELVAELKQFARQGRGTLFLALMTGFQLLLGQLSGQEDLVLGTIIGGRQAGQSWDQVGLFANALPLRADLSGNPTVRELFERVRATVVASFDHQDLPFEEVVRALNPPRSHAHTPLFQALLVVRDGHRDGSAFEGLREHWEHVQTGLTLFDLTLTISEGRDGLEAGLEYLAALFDPATVEGFKEQFLRLLRAMVEDPERRLGDLPGVAQDRQDPPESAGAVREMPREGVHAAFERQAALRPGAVALTCAGRSLTYAALEQLSGQVAAGLQARGAGPGVPVGIFMHTSLEQMVAVLGILRAGAMYVPLNPDHPAARNAHALEDAGLAWVLTDPDCLGRLPASPARALTLDLAALAAAGPASVAPTDVADQPACLLYTSGSTGRPKGVLVNHRGMVNILEFMADLLGTGPGDRTLALTPLTFDISAVERLLPLRAGAEAALVDRATAVNPYALAQAIDQLAPTVLQATPATWQMLAQAGWRGRPGMKLLCGGETMPAPVAEFLLAQGGEVWNLYGPTETTIWSTCHRVRAADLPAIPIGLPVWNTRVRILDPHLRPVAPGAVGELCLAGSGLADGYRNLEAQTRERFPEDPGHPGERLYRTGDLACWRPDGTLGFHGRLDHQVKIRGYRIELMEVEAALGRHPDVLQAVVDVREGANGPRMVAFLVPRGSARLSRVSLREFMKGIVPAYMIPEHFVSTTGLPFRNGKVDRHAVHAKALDGPAGEAPGVPPRTPTEALLAQIWEDLLERREVGILDDFFDLGGHSLLIVQLLGRIEEAFGRRLAIAGLFQGITIEGLARSLTPGQADPVERAWVELQPGAGGPPLFFLHGDLPGFGLYCRSLARRLGADQGMVAIHPHGCAGQPMASSIEAMAADHLALIRRLQPRGPYRLGGYCNGAMEALEIARQLSAQGERVERLLMVAPPGAWLRERNLDHAMQAVQEWIQGVQQWQRPAMAAILEAVLRHELSPYSGPVTLLIPEDRPPQDPDLGWGELLPALRHVDIAGDHISCLTHPGLGERLRACLDQPPSPE